MFGLMRLHSNKDHDELLSHGQTVQIFHGKDIATLSLCLVVWM